MKKIFSIFCIFISSLCVAQNAFPLESVLPLGNIGTRGACCNPNYPKYQIKGIQDPTQSQDVVTLNYFNIHTSTLIPASTVTCSVSPLVISGHCISISANSFIQTITGTSPIVASTSTSTTSISCPTCLVQGANTYTANTILNETGNLSLKPSGTYSLAIGGNSFENIGGNFSETSTAYTIKASNNYSVNTTGGNIFLTPNASVFINGGSSLGIGTLSPLAAIHVIGQGNSSSDFVAQFNNLSNVAIFKIRDDKRIIYTDGNEGAGKILTSDVNGVGTWQTASTTSIVAGSNITLNQSGNTYTITGSSGGGSSQWVTATSPSTAITYTVGSIGVGTNNVGATCDLNSASSNSTSATYAVKVNNGELTPRNLFRINNAGLIEIGSSVSQSISIGYSTGLVKASSSNTFLGNQIALYLIEGSGYTGYGCTAVGNSAVANLRNAYAITAVGVRAGTGSNYVDASSDCFFGFEAGSGITSGSYNNFMGFQCATKLTTGSQNDAYGRLALNTCVTGVGNACFGHASLNQTTGGFNTAIGNNAGQNATGSNNVFVGNYAGNYQTSVSNTFFVDNQDRTNAQGEKNSSLLYGNFNATPTSQQLIINGAIYLKDATTPFHYWYATLNSGLLTWTDTGSANAP